MANWTRDHKVALWVGAMAAAAVIIAAIITVAWTPADGNDVEQKTGGDGTICIESKC
ncbi:MULTISPECIES: hypothetical protein [unclassified Streptomyces]|uniref:hypothetical protein n=1 Tax=unclassified Streptomyces TaxID=2593676 RepID=UPI001C252B80|nr:MULTISPECIES: hypothetical protein [unclassified Streptomyces]MCC9709338.1 hypothetical protein [Streptomyces sp. MNU76]